MSIWALDGQEPRIDPTAYVHPDATVIGSVVIGAEASIWPGAVLRADYGRIEVGARTSVQDGAVVHTTAEHPTVIGADCVVGHVAHLEGCTVEDGVLIGSHSVVLARARVCTGGVVGGSALVPEGFTVPAGHMALGVPARLREARLAEGWLEWAVGQYVDNARRYRRELRRVAD